MTHDRITELEEQVAHLARTVEELSDVLARQDKEAALMANRVRLLMQRESERENNSGGAAAIGDQRPPHW